MRFSLSATLAMCGVCVHATAAKEVEVFPQGMDGFQRRLASSPGPQPVQIYYIPLPEDQLLSSTFDKINAVTKQPVISIISIAIAADDTYVWYDHWEDGYEADILNPTQSSTQIWGDGKTSNGCAPGKPCSTAADDKLKAGEAIVIQNNVPIPRDPSVILFDGRDKIYVSFPVAVTRAAYPSNPGSLMAGATEVTETGGYGTSFIAPVGQNTAVQSGSDAVYTEAFTTSQMYVMAAGNTTLTLPNKSTVSISEGQSYVISNVNEGDSVTSTSPVQVDLVTGRAKSTYELRWYTLLDVTNWSNDYFSPMGSGTPADRGTRYWVYNPNAAPLTVTVAAFSNTGTLVVPSKTAAITSNVGNNNGVRFTASSHFFVISQTDASATGELYDWGFSVTPTGDLAPQGLVGLGFGCTNDKCDSKGARSVVFASPVKLCNIYFDYNNDGTPDKTFSNVAPLQSVNTTDPSDNDMTGAFVYAKDSTGNPVNIAIAWGQDPNRSYSADVFALDLGTVVPPFPSIVAGKSGTLGKDNDNNGMLSVGDTLVYTIRIVNAGVVLVPKTSFVVFDDPADLFTNTAYVPGSTTYTNYDASGAVTSTGTVADDAKPATLFPLDERGIQNPYPLVPKGGFQEVQFVVSVTGTSGDPTECGFTISNKGEIDPAGGPGSGNPFSTFTAMNDVNCPTTSSTTTTTTTMAPLTTTTGGTGGSATSTTNPPITGSTTTGGTGGSATSTTIASTTTTGGTGGTGGSASSTSMFTTIARTGGSATSTTIAPTKCQQTCANPTCIDLTAGNNCNVGNVCICFEGASSTDPTIDVCISVINECCLTENHICNLPLMSYSLDPCKSTLEFPIDVATVYDFMCSDQTGDEDVLVSGHSTVQCNTPLPNNCPQSATGRRLQGLKGNRELAATTVAAGANTYSAYYSFTLHCSMGKESIVFPTSSP